MFENNTQGDDMRDELPFILLAAGMAVEAYFLPLLAITQLLFFVAFYVIRSSG